MICYQHCAQIYSCLPDLGVLLSSLCDKELINITYQKSNHIFMHWDWCEETFKDQLQTHMPNKKKKLRHIKKLIAGNANLLNKRNSVYQMMLINTEY